MSLYIDSWIISSTYQNVVLNLLYQFWYRFLWMECWPFHSYHSILTKIWKKEKYFEAFGIGISLTEIADIEENDKLPITNENSTSTSILDQINTGLEQLNV